MAEFWEALGIPGQIYFVMAAVASILLVIQMIFLIIGFVGGGLGDVDGTDYDADFDSDGSTDAGLFTLKGLIGFFAIGGWVGVAMVLSDIHIAITIIVSLLCGGAALIGIGFLYRAMYKLQSSGNININNAVGKTAEVYLTVPAGDSGTGKVTVLVQERETEFEARTNNSAPLKTGSVVKVVSVLNNTLFVEPVEMQGDIIKITDGDKK